MTKVTNLAEYGIAEENVKGFLNKALYTDCESYLVYEKAGQLFAVLVVRDGFKPEWKEGYCVNNQEQYYYPVKIAKNGRHLSIAKKRGTYGFTDLVYVGGTWVTKDRSLIGETHGNCMIVAWGDKSVRYAELTPAGKLKTRFIKIAEEIKEVSTQFHDNNF